MKKVTIQLLALLLVAIPLLSVLAKETSAASSRVAVIQQLTGAAKVKKAGGSKEFTAFTKMSLNEGDILTVGAKGSVVLKFANGTSEDDQMTASENTTLTFSKLSNSKGTTTKVSILKGTVWSTVKSITNKDDKFTLETPTSIMGVRGTTLLVGVDPETGESKFYIASGQGKVSKKGEEEQETGTLVNPNQQLNIDMDTESDDYDDYNNIADLDDLIKNTSNAIIEAIIASKAAIDIENALYIAKLKAGNTESNQQEIDRINQNLDNLVANIVKNAIKQNKVDEAAIRAFVDEVNKSLTKKIDLDNAKAQELSLQEKAKQAQIKLLEAERKKKQEAEKLKQDELKKQNEELQKKLKEQLEKQKAEKEKAEEAAKKKAAEEYAKKLADDAARLAFEAKQKALADEKAKQVAAAAAYAKKLEDAAKQQATPSPSPGSSGGGGLDSGEGTTPSLSPSLLTTLTLNPGTLNFESNSRVYNVNVEHDVSSITVAASATTGAVIQINNGVSSTTTASASIPLQEGSNEITIKVTESGKALSTYTLTVIRAEQTDTEFYGVKYWDYDNEEWSVLWAFEGAPAESPEINLGTVAVNVDRLLISNKWSELEAITLDSEYVQYVEVLGGYLVDIEAGMMQEIPLTIESSSLTVYLIVDRSVYPEGISYIGGEVYVNLWMPEIDGNGIPHYNVRAENLSATFRVNYSQELRLFVNDEEFSGVLEQEEYVYSYSIETGETEIKLVKTVNEEDVIVAFIIIEYIPVN
jgi:hypothetical protein